MPPQAPPHLPHLHSTEILELGMQPLEGQWLTPGDAAGVEAGRKRALRDQLGEGVYQVLPAGLEAAVELADRIRRSVGLADDVFQGLPREEWLWRASLAVFDDLAVMVPDGGSYTLAAASLCSPSHWRLPDKIGRPMARIHDPIPGIHERLTPKIDRVFGHLRVDRPVERLNWSLQDDDVLFRWPKEHPEQLPDDTRLFYRVERQTLSRLPESGALAFSIRVYLDPLDSLRSVPGALSKLLAAVDGMDPALRHYKGLDRYARALDRYR